MRNALFAAVLLAAAPGAVAWAQSQSTRGSSTDGAYQAPNLANPQAQANQQMNPPEARQDPSSGAATSIPTPTLGGSTKVPQNPVH